MEISEGLKAINLNNISRPKSNVKVAYMNNATTVFQEKCILANESVHHVPSQHFFAVDPYHPLSTYRAMLKFNIVKFPSDWNHPSRYEVVFAVVFLERFAVIRDCDVHSTEFSYHEIATATLVVSFDLRSPAHDSESDVLLCPTVVAIVF